MSKIKVFKLVTGEEIIGKAVSVNPETKNIQMESVLSIGIMPTGNGQVQVRMMPFMISGSEGTVDLDIDKIVAEANTPSEDLINAYVQQTSGIQLAGNMNNVTPLRKN